MCVILDDITDKKVYPIIIKNGGNEYLTLYYYTAKDDSILHNDTHLICFHSFDVLQNFCADHDLSIEQETYLFDFDLPIVNPTDYKAVLEKWNLLNTIANIFQMYFEGNDRRYTRLYDILFRYLVSSEPLSATVALDERLNRQLIRVFKKKDRFLKKFIDFVLCVDFKAQI